MKNKTFFSILSFTLLLSGCNFPQNNSTNSNSSSNNDISNYDPTAESFFKTVKNENKEISKDEYFNKTLGGLLGQFAGFLSGYEFVWTAGGAYLGLPEEWFDFLNGPYAGNYTHYWPGSYAEGNNKYDRLKVNPDTGRNEVWSDDDFHVDIFNQTVIKEFGTTSYGLKEGWKYYKVADWGGGYDAMTLISGKDMLSPYTGTIEAGNRYGWCTEAYIENETLGMNAPGMPNLATRLADTFAANTGYFDSVIWGKFYAAMYSIAYFEDDIRDVMKEAKKVLPKGSYPYQIYELAHEYYNKYPNDYKKAAQKLEEHRRMLYRIDNIQTDPNINGGFAILSWLYGNNSYLDTCKYSSIMGYDGDCTAATCVGVMGIIHGFKEGNEEYKELNETIYYDGEGIYFNDRESTFPPYIMSNEYFTRIKIDDIIKLYQENFETLLVEQGGEIKEDKYIIPTTPVYDDHSLLFENCDGELRDTTGFKFNNGKLTSIVESETGLTHTGYGAFKLTNIKNGQAYHTFDNLVKGRSYRVSAYVTTSEDTQVEFFASTEDDYQSISFANVKSIINKSFIFEATDSSMKVGFKFAESAKNGAVLTFDDYFIEEIERTKLSSIAEQNYVVANGKYIKQITKPENVELGEEVYLEIAYRHYGQAIAAKVLRNGEVYGSVMLSTTSINAIKGNAVVQIPYVFEKTTDTIQLVFENTKINIGNSNIYNRTQYMFR